MKRMKSGLMGMFAVALAVGFAFAGCDSGGGGSGGGGGGAGGGTGPNGIAVPATRGRLTITGLDAYNGKYVVAQGMIDERTGTGLYGCSGMTAEGIQGARIANGSVTLNIWQFVMSENAETPERPNIAVQAYTGGDSVQMGVAILGNQNVGYDANMDALAVGSAMVSAVFANGSAAGVAVDAGGTGGGDGSRKTVTVDGLESHVGKFAGIILHSASQWNVANASGTVASDGTLTVNLNYYNTSNPWNQTGNYYVQLSFYPPGGGDSTYTGWTDQNSLIPVGSGSITVHAEAFSPAP